MNIGKKIYSEIIRDITQNIWSPPHFFSFLDFNLWLFLRNGLGRFIENSIDNRTYNSINKIISEQNEIRKDN